jgi:hypothetical protein
MRSVKFPFTLVMDTVWWRAQKITPPVYKQVKDILGFPFILRSLGDIVDAPFNVQS